MFKRLLFLVWFISLVAEAQQKVPVQEGTTVTVTVSSNALNRIAIENDRIVTVKGVSGQFELDKDTELGQIFLKPVSTDPQGLIHLFLTTENGHTYPLSLLIEEGVAQSILLMPLNEGTPSQWEQSSSYEHLLKTLVQAMVNQTTLEGFTQENIKGAKISVPKIKHATITSVHTYTNHKLQGQVLEVSNTGKEALSLTEPYFYQKGVRAVAIVNNKVPAHHKTHVYVVR